MPSRASNDTSQSSDLLAVPEQGERWQWPSAISRRSTTPEQARRHRRRSAPVQCDHRSQGRILAACASRRHAAAPVRHEIAAARSGPRAGYPSWKGPPGRGLPSVAAQASGASRAGVRAQTSPPPAGGSQRIGRAFGVRTLGSWPKARRSARNSAPCATTSTGAGRASGAVHRRHGAGEQRGEGLGAFGRVGAGDPVVVPVAHRLAFLLAEIHLAQVVVEGGDRQAERLRRDLRRDPRAGQRRGDDGGDAACLRASAPRAPPGRARPRSAGCRCGPATGPARSSPSRRGGGTRRARVGRAAPAPCQAAKPSCSSVRCTAGRAFIRP